MLVRHKLSEVTAGSNSKASLVTAGVLVQLQTLWYVLLLLLLLLLVLVHLLVLLLLLLFQLVRPGCFPMLLL